MRRGDWIQTYTGRQFWPLDPQVEDIAIEDIAHALSQQCRYAGHTSFFYSVAEHCCHIADQSPAGAKLWGLLHDASEAYLVDIPRPLKPFLTEYRQIEARLMEVICDRFGLPVDMPAAVHALDGRILANERRMLMAPPPAPWADTGPPINGLDLLCWSPWQAEQQFLQRFELLTKGRTQ